MACSIKVSNSFVSFVVCKPENGIPDDATSASYSRTEQTGPCAWTLLCMDLCKLATYPSQMKIKQTHTHCFNMFQ